MAIVTRWDITRDVNTRHDSNGNWGRGGSSIRYIGKGHTGEYFRAFMRFAKEWADMSGALVTRAELVLHTHEEGSWEIGSKAAINVHYLTQEFDNSSGDTWTHDAYVNPSAGDQVGTLRAGIPTSDDQPFRINILKYIQRIADSNVSVQIGTVISKGEGKNDHGIRLRSPDEKDVNLHVSIYSGDGAAPGHARPYIEIEWDPANTPPSATWGGPLGASSSDEDYVGTYFDSDGDRATHAQVQVWRSGDNDPDDSGADSAARYDSGKVPWQSGWPDGQYIVPPPQRLSPPKTRLPRKDGNGNTITYHGRVRVWDKGGVGPWTAANNLFTVTSSDPVVTPMALNTQATLGSTRFRAEWNYDPAAGGVASYRVQLTARFDSGAWAEPIWEHTFAPTKAEQTDAVSGGRQGRSNFVYLGPSLPAGNYSWRIMVVDGLGADSPWGQDDTLVLPTGTTNDAELPDNSTVYGRFAITTRLVMRDTNGPNRGPGTVVAIIENPYNLAVTGNASTPGQLSFSLPNRHPQISAMEPIRTHWSLQQYRGSEWRELSAGLLTDFDATETNTIFFGLDYLGVLSLSIEAKAQPTDHAEASWDANGAKYVNKSISSIISDQLKRAIAGANSPVGFFVSPPLVDSMLERVTIHSAYAQRLDFIRGLLDSHRGGAAGRRARITAAKNPVSGLYEFTVRSNAGKDRPNLVFQYGGLVQAYRVMALGDWADKIYGVGRLRNELKPHYQSLSAPGVSLSEWGEIAKANVWQDISDINDLTRRTRQMATEASRAGKRIALGLRVHGLALLDGWGICDNIKLDIEHGSVSTPDYGTSGWWTIWGWEWRLYPDGHDDLTLVLRPTEGVGAPVDDLIPSSPIHVQPEWRVAYGPPGLGFLRLDAGYFLDSELHLDTRL